MRYLGQVSLPHPSAARADALPQLRGPGVRPDGAPHAGPQPAARGGGPESVERVSARDVHDALTSEGRAVKGMCVMVPAGISTDLLDWCLCSDG